VGVAVGPTVGSLVGTSVAVALGSAVGSIVGTSVAVALGSTMAVGSVMTCVTGLSVGAIVGWGVDVNVGSSVGLSVGSCDATIVGPDVSTARGVAEMSATAAAVGVDAERLVRRTVSNPTIVSASTAAAAVPVIK
jgi:hypothetical protein